MIKVDNVYEATVSIYVTNGISLSSLREGKDMRQAWHLSELWLGILLLMTQGDAM